ncbi:MAG: PKD domain-containing protein [Ferruginibacter sp.]
MRKFLLLLSISILPVSLLFAQDFSNKGKDFWVCYPDHIDGTNSVMGIYLTSDVNATGQLNVAGTIVPFTVTANTVTTKFIGPNGGGAAGNIAPYLGLQDGIKNGAGIRVTSDNNIAVYAHIIRSARSGATLILPTKVWGKDYIIPSYRNSGNTNGYGELVVMASLPNTIVEITPKITTRSGRPAGVPFQITLVNPGDVYQVQFQSAQDASGTRVKSIASGTSGCLPIAVFSATTWTGLACSGASGGDNLYQQIFPIGSWGKQFLTSPLKKIATNPSDNNSDIIRVFVTDPTTVISKIENGASSTLGGLIANSYYEYATPFPTFIQADKPIQVVQYITSQTCGSPQTLSDPEMIVLNAVEQTINDITVFSAHQNFVPSGQSQVTTHYLNIIMKTNNTASFQINGSAPAASFIAIPGTAYSYLKENITARAATNPISRLSADSGFSAIAYGFGNFESYGYNAGTNVKDLYQQIGVSNQYGIETTPSVCLNSPFKFKVSLPYIPDSLYWNFGNAPGMLPNNNNVNVVNTGNGTEDSTTIVNGVTLHWYSLSLFYTFTTAGNFPITITTYSPNGDCGTSQDIEFSLQVSSPPVPDFNFTIPNCITEPVLFTEITPQTPKPTYRWYWNFGDPGSGANNTSTLRNPIHTFSSPGPHIIKFASITTPGCLLDTITKIINIAPIPTATISGSTAVCINATSPLITFTASGGTAPFTFTYNLNGGATQSISTITGNSVSIAAPTGTIGSNTYNLLSVQSNGSTLCQQAQTGSATITVRTQPAGSISGANTVCLGGISPVISFTGANGTTPYTFYYNINGGATQTITTTTGNTTTLSAPTTVAGTFIYNLSRVEDANGPLCGLNQTANTTVIVKPLPTAAISGSVTVCRNATSPLVTFTGASGTAPYTFRYNINGGATQTIATTSGNSVTIAVNTTATGTFIYNLISVTEGSANACTQPQSGSVTVTVNPLPTATISGAATVCLNATAPNVTFTGASASAPYTFSYNINGGPVQTITTATGNSVTIPAPTNTAGIFVYNLVSVKEATGSLCSQAQTGSVTITVNALPVATITGTISVCKNATAPLITLTGNGGTAPYTFTYNIGGGPGQTISTTSGNSVSIAVPTGTAGAYTYNLLSVTEGSSLACTKALSGSVTVTVNNLPTASISGDNEVCRNAASPLVVFTGAGTIAPYLFTYNINGGANQTTTTTSGNSISLSAPTNVAGTFVYNLVSVRDASSTTCSQAQTGIVTIIINALPVAAFTPQVPSCSSGTVSFTDNSTANAGTLTEWAWDFGDLASGTQNTSNLQNPVHYFSTAGTYNVSLVVKSSKGCFSSSQVQAVIVNAKPKAGFINPQVCLSDTYASFIDTSSAAGSTITGWQWNFDDAGSGALNTSTLQNPQHSYSTVGTKNVRLIVTSSVGCRDTIIQSFVVNGDIPVAGFTVLNNTSLCANDTVKIANTSTVNVGSVIRIEIYWDNSGTPASFDTYLTPSPGAVFGHKYPTATVTRTYNIRYRVYSGITCINDKFQAISVNAAPSVRFNAVPPTCLNVAPFQISQASETGGVAGSAVYSGSGVSSSGLFNPASVGPGNYRILYTYTSAFGCKDTASQVIAVLAAPVASFTTGLPACENNALDFIDNSTSTVGSLTMWTWNFGDGSPTVIRTNGNTFTHTFNAAGTFSVSLIVTTSDGCKSLPKTLSVMVAPAPRPDFTFYPSVCLPQASVAFNNTSSIANGTENSFVYNWTFGDGSPNSTAKNPTHVYTTAGPFPVKLQVTSGAGCVRDTTIIVNTIHPAPLAKFDFDKTSVCVGGTLSLLDQSSGLDANLTNWNWKFGDGGISSIQAPSHSYSNAGTYSIQLTVTNSFGCVSDIFTKAFTVYPYPTVDAGPDAFVLEGGSTNLKPVVTGNGLSYLWSPALYLNNATVAQPTSTPQRDIRYLLTVTAQGGCSDTSSVFIKVLLGPEIPNTFTPNNDGINDFWEIRYLNTYPNNRVQVFSRTGQLVFESKGYPRPWDGNMKGKSLPVDTYYYIIEPGNGRKPLKGYVTIIK